MTIGEMRYKITGDNSQFRSAMADTDRQVGKSTKTMGGLSLGTAALAASFILVAKKVFDFAKASVIAAGKMEALTTQFQVMLGSAAKARDLMSQLTQFAASTPFQLEDLAKGTQNLLAFGVAESEVIDVMRMLGDTAGGNAEKLNGLVLAYGKVQVKGKASLEEINMIAEKGIPIYDTLASNLGVTREQLLEMVSAGQVSAQDITDAFSTMTSEGGLFFNGMEMQSMTFEGVMSTLSDNVELLKAAFGQGLLPVVKNAAIQLTQFIQGPLMQMADETGRMARVLGIAGRDIKENFGENIAQAAVDLKDDFLDMLSVISGGATGFQVLAGTAKILGIILETLFKVIKLNYNIIFTFFETIVIGARTAIEAVLGLVEGLTTNNWDRARNALGDGFTEMWDNIRDAAVDTADDFVDVFNDIKDVATSFKEENEALSEEMREAYEEGPIPVLHEIQEELEETSDTAGETGEEIGESLEEAALRGEIAFSTFQERLKNVLNDAGQLGGGLIDIFGGVADYQSARTKARIEELDLAMKDELDNAALTSEEREQIEAEYAKKKAKLEYKGALGSWRMNLASAIATAPLNIMRAMTSAFAAPWPLSLAFVALMTGMASASNALNIAAIVASKPKAPQFQDSGIVPGRSFVGDNVSIQANSGEMVLNESDQASLFGMIKGGGGGGSAVILEGSVLGRWVENYFNDGRGHIRQSAIIT